MDRVVVCLDCQHYQKGGRCRKTGKDVGALQETCEKAHEPFTRMDMIKPVKPKPEKKAEDKPEKKKPSKPKTTPMKKTEKPTPAPVLNEGIVTVKTGPVNPFSTFKDHELADELRARGYEVTATRTVTITL